MRKDIQRISDAKLQQDDLRRRMLDKLAGRTPEKSYDTTQQTYDNVPRTSCVLYDISGSMKEYLGANNRKIDALRIVAQDFKNVRGFWFSSDCGELKGEKIPEPWGGTALNRAFIKLKDSGISHVVVVTDGRPDSEEKALHEAKGLVVDCFYIGPDPIPGFLIKLCNQTGGQFGKASLTSPKELGAAMKVRLGIEAPKESKGPIIL